MKNPLHWLFKPRPQPSPPPAASAPTAGVPAPTAANDSANAAAPSLEEMLAKPYFVIDPVFPKTGYLTAYAQVAFRQLLTRSNLTDLIAHITDSSATEQMVMLRAQSMGFWAIDLASVSPRGVTGKEEFMGRAKDPIRRPPPELAAVVAEQHILARGVSEIQLQGEPLASGQAQICPVRTIGWYCANILIPRASPPAANPAAKP